MSKLLSIARQPLRIVPREMPITKPAPEPALRPRCGCCQKPLRPDYAIDWHGNTRGWTGRYLGESPFCTKRCALAFARAAYRAGFRVKGDHT